MNRFSQRFAVMLVRALAAFVIFLIARRFRLLMIELEPARRGLRESGAVFEGEYRQDGARTE